MVIAPDAQPIARCARVTLLTPEPLPIDQVERLLAEAVSAASLELKSSEDVWIGHNCPLALTAQQHFV